MFRTRGPLMLLLVQLPCTEVGKKSPPHQGLSEHWTGQIWPPYFAGRSFQGFLFSGVPHCKFACRQCDTVLLDSLHELL